MHGFGADTVARWRTRATGLVPLSIGALTRPQLLVALKALLSTQVTAVLEHIPRVRMQSPVGAFSRFIRRPGHFDETVIERQRMPDGVLPPLLILTVVGKQVHYPLIYLT